MRNIIFGTISILFILGLVAASFIAPYAAEKEVELSIPGSITISTEFPYHGIREIDIAYILKDVGHFLVYGGISDMEYYKMVKAWDLFESKRIKHVVIHLNSGGGEIFSGMAMAQLMRENGSHGKRMVSPYALIMVHELSTYTYRSSDTTGDKRKQAKILKMIQDNGTKFMSDMTGIPFEELVVMREEETWFSAEEAVELGFADGLLNFAPGGKE